MLKEAGEFLAFIFGNLFKGIWFLIRKAGLWIPLAFTVLFFVILGVTRTPFSTLKGIFIAGLVVTAVIGVAFGVAANAKKLISKKLPEKTREGQITRVTVPEDGKPAEPPAAENPVSAPRKTDGNHDTERYEPAYYEDEQPKIYRTRRADDVLIYEYSDRLDYYRIRGVAREKIYTEYKSADGSVPARDFLNR